MNSTPSKLEMNFSYLFLLLPIKFTNFGKSLPNVHSQSISYQFHSRISMSFLFTDFIII